MLFSFRSQVGWFMAFLLLATRGGAATFLAGGYTLRVWQTDDGLPQNVVTSAVQTEDGYLWFGTYSGLARFNGERFQVFNSANTPSLRDRRVARLFEDANGTLWIGHETGAITRYADGAFTPFAPAPGRENERAIGLGSDEAGTLWVMRENGAVEALDDDRRLPSLIAPDRPEIMAWTRSDRGNVWVAQNGRAAQLVNGELTPAKFDAPRYNDSVVGLAASAGGGVWILRDGLIRKWKNDRWVDQRGTYPWAFGTVACCLELRDGTLAVGTIYSGLYLIFGDGRPSVHFDRSHGLPQDWIRFLFEDREGTLWAGTGSAGMVSIHPSPLTVLNAPDQWEGCTVVSVAPGRNGSLWIGTDGAGLYHHSTARGWIHYGEAEGLSNRFIQAVTETPEGEVWVGNFWWGGPYRLEQGRFVRPSTVDETWSPALALVALPESGQLLVGNRDGLLQLTESSSQWLIKSPEGSTDDVNAIVQDRDGAIWCGFAQGGLARLAGDKVTLFRRQDGLASDAVHCLWPDDDGTLWIGTADNGLSRLKDGKFTSLGVAQGLADNVVCHILDDGLGHLWISTHRGLQRVAKEELNRCADGVIPIFGSYVYDRDDGLPVVEFTGGRQSAACKTSDGRLWFASSKGVITVDPTRIQHNLLPPPVVLEQFTVDQETLPFTNGALSTQLWPDHQRLEFRFSGLSYVVPSKVRFKYRLEGIDNTWREAGVERTAAYSRLPAGTYRFHVIAANHDRIWNSEGATVAFTVAPFFWQTWWFIGLSAAGVATGIALFARALTRRRMQRKLEEMEQKHAVELERTRIAQDIHDDVGASLSRIAMLSQPARSHLAEPDRAAAVLTRIYTTAREVTRSLDEIVWAIDPRHDTLDSLVDYMGRFAQDLLAAAGLRCRLDLPVHVPPWPLTAEVRHNVFLAFKEALHNAAKHSHATEVRISLRLSSGAFELLVVDNGRGFDLAQRRSASEDRINSGRGLASMNQRLARIRGRCDVASTPGEGTRVSLIVEVDEAVSALAPPHDRA